MNDENDTVWDTFDIKAKATATAETKPETGTASLHLPRVPTCPNHMPPYRLLRRWCLRNFDQTEPLNVSLTPLARMVFFVFYTSTDILRHFCAYSPYT